MLMFNENPEIVEIDKMLKVVESFRGSKGGVYLSSTTANGKFLVQLENDRGHWREVANEADLKAMIAAAKAAGPAINQETPGNQVKARGRGDWR